MIGLFLWFTCVNANVLGDDYLSPLKSILTMAKSAEMWLIKVI